MNLRDYQRDAIDAIYTHFETSGDNPLVVVPTGGGKSAILATFIKEAIEQYPDTRILCLVHVRELVDQSYKTLLRIWPSAPVGVFSAGLGKRDLRKQITMASIQSVYKRAYELQRQDLIIVDEAHLIPHGGDGMYRQLLGELLQINPYAKMVGLTATHWRMSSGLLTEGEGALFGSVAYEVTLRMLLDGGYLVPPLTKSSQTQISTAGVAVRGGEFVAKDLAKAADRDTITQQAADEIVALGSDRRSWLAFCSGVEHAYHVRDAIRARGISAETVTGETPQEQRAAIVASYRAGRIRCLTGVDVFLTGFDAPATDLIAVLRPTKSSALWLQLLGRGLRISPETGKTDVLVLDYSSNSVTFGPIDQIKPKSKRKSEEPTAAPHKSCPECEAKVPAGATTCMECGYAFPPNELKIDAHASTAPLLSTQVKPEWVNVSYVTYSRHERAGKIPSMKVSYLCGMVQHNEWVCPIHDGYPRQQFVTWWQRRAPGLAVPDTLEEALDQSPILRKPTAVQVRKDGKFFRIVGAQL
jgi:DNA repair protein RadD